jgi:putative two-component system response regulator
MIIDDLHENIDLIKTFFINDSYNFMSATNGEDAIVLINDTPPDIILLDIVMPGMDGFEVCKKLKSSHNTRFIPIIMVTGMHDHKSKLKGIETGADDFITKPIDIFELKARVASLLRIKEYTDQLQSAERIMYNIALSLEAKDPTTKGRCTRLANYGSLLAEKLGLDEAQIRAVRKGGVLHDIGKLTIQDNILLKPGPLSTDEFSIIKTHPGAGEYICKPLKTLEDVLPVIRSHQERYDGSGYPDGLKGDEIPLTAQIIAISECYDALRTDRPYRKALSNQEALEIMNKETAQGKWDPKLIGEFQELLMDPDIQEKLNRNISEINNLN